MYGLGTVNCCLLCWSGNLLLLVADKEMSKCTCGRSPTGFCVGWHALSKETYKKHKKKYDKLSEEKKKVAFHYRAIDGIGE